ncbi:MAG: hypothetical protein ACJ72D_07820 [Marmoricola sp.]
MRLRPTSAAAIALVAAAALTLTGCGSAKQPAADAPGTALTTPTGDGTPDPGPGTTSDTTPTPTPTPTETEGDGDSEGDDTPATAGGGICGDLSADVVGAVLGGTVKGAALPGGGCAFTQASSKAPAATFVERSLAKTPGGMEGAKTDATSSVEGTPQNLSGIGDAAFVVTGTAFGEPAVQGAGAVLVGKRVISINLTQGSGLSAATVKAMTVKLLRLAATQAG